MVILLLVPVCAGACTERWAVFPSKAVPGADGEEGVA